jgi:hypothetical protein
MVLFLWGALSDERTGLSSVGVFACISRSFVIMKKMFTFYIFVRVRVTLRLTVSQSVSKSWWRAPSMTHDQIFITV